MVLVSWLSLKLLMSSSEKLGCLSFVEGIEVMLIWMLVESLLRNSPLCLVRFDFLLLSGDMLFDLVQNKKPTAGSLDGWGWREFKALPVAWFDRLASILTLVEEEGVWPDGLLDAYIAVIPKMDGDSTPLGQRP